MVINSRAKGARGEREWAKFCRDQGYGKVRRGQQYSGIEGEDCVGLPGIHQEVKRVEALHLDNAMMQSAKDAKRGELPIVAHRKNGWTWKITMDAEDWFTIYREWEAGRSANND